MWKCPKCGDTSVIGLAVGNPTCSRDGTELVPMNTSESPGIQPPPISIGGKVSVGGNVNNAGKIKVFPNGELSINKDLINTGDLTINDPEKMKELLIEVVKTSGSLVELGSNILKTFFQTS